MNQLDQSKFVWGDMTEKEKSDLLAHAKSIYENKLVLEKECMFPKTFDEFKKRYHKDEKTAKMAVAAFVSSVAKEWYNGLNKDREVVEHWTSIQNIMHTE